MSAALTLPYVWAAVSDQRVEKNTRLRPLGGADLLPEKHRNIAAQIYARIDGHGAGSIGDGQYRVPRTGIKSPY